MAEKETMRYEPALQSVIDNKKCYLEKETLSKETMPSKSKKLFYSDCKLIQEEKLGLMDQTDNEINPPLHPSGVFFERFVFSSCQPGFFQKVGQTIGESFPPHSINILYYGNGDAMGTLKILDELEKIA